MIGVKYKQTPRDPFTGPRVVFPIKRGLAKVFGHFGGWVRKTARRSMPKRKKLSRPGQPPSAHTGAIKNLILYAYDDHARSVVIGPILGSSRSGAPAALEWGGISRMTAGKRQGEKIRIQPRPYMTPAFEKGTTLLLPKLWQNSIK
jgi:hypothetical protein